MKRVAALGSWNGDDSIAWLLLRRLMADYRCPADVQLLVCDRSGMEWLYGEVPDWLLLVDAVQSGGAPGTVHYFRYADSLPVTAAAGSLTSHGLPLPEGLELARRLGRLPAEVWIWGVETGMSSELQDLSPALRENMHDLVRQLADVLGLVREARIR